MKLLSPIEDGIIQVLAQHGGWMTGKEIRRSLEEAAGKMMSIGVIYNTLDRLEKKGEIESRKIGEARTEFRYVHQRPGISPELVPA